MTKDEFLLAMERALEPLPANERIDILGDYMEHFRAGEEQGKTGEEIAEGLGDPAELSRSYLDGRETPLREDTAAGTGPATPPIPPIPPIPPVPLDANGYPQPEPAPGVGTAPPPPPVPPQGTAYAYPVNQPRQAGASNQALAVVLVILFNIMIGAPLFFGVMMGLFGIAMAAVGLLVCAVALFIFSAAAFGLSPAAGGTVICGGVAVLALSVLLGVAVAALIRVCVIGLTKYIRFCERICREGRWPS